MDRGSRISKLSHISSSQVERGLFWSLSLATLGATLFVGGRYYPDIKQAFSKEPNKPKAEVSMIPVEQNAPRQALLDAVFAETKPEYISKVVYDPDGTKREEYFKQQLLRIGQSITVGNIRTSHYDTAIFGYNDEIGSGNKSVFFVGTALFDRGYSGDDWHNIISRGNRYAEVQARGFDGIASSKLINSIRSGKIPVDFFYHLRNLDADAFGLQNANLLALSPACRNDLISKVEGTKVLVQEVYLALTPDARDIVNKISSPFGIEYTSSPREIRPIPASDKPKKSRFF